MYEKLLFAVTVVQRCYVLVHSRPDKVGWGTFQGNIPTIFRSLPNVVGQKKANFRKVSHYWQGVSMAGGAKVPGRSIVQEAYLSMYIHYIQQYMYINSGVETPYKEL